MAACVLGAAASLISAFVPEHQAPQMVVASACGEQLSDVAGLLEGLRGGPSLSVERTAEGALRVATLDARTLLVASCAGLEVGPGLLERPAPGEPSRAMVGPGGAWTYALTARGAQILVIEPGELNELGLHLTVFDNDDFHLADGQGRLVASAATGPLGALVEREGPQYGCGCERTTLTDGRVVTEPLELQTR